jgi:hypothetical protein
MRDYATAFSTPAWTHATEYAVVAQQAIRPIEPVGSYGAMGISCLT